MQTTANNPKSKASKERREGTQAPKPSSGVVIQPPKLVRGHVLQNGLNSMKPALLKEGHDGLRTDSVWGDVYASVKADAVAYEKLTFLVELVLDLAGIRKTLPGFAKGRELVMKQFACTHVYSIEDLMTMGTKSIIETLDAVEGKIKAAAKQLGDSMKIKAKEQVLRDLGLWLHELTADIAGHVTLSEKNVGQQ